MYAFDTLEKIKNFKYTNKEKIGKDNYIYYLSFDGEAENLNNHKKQLLINHKKVIDSAITYAYNQINGPAKADVCHIIKYDKLNSKYAYQINKYAEYKYKVDKHLIDEKKNNCVQKYWIYSKHIKTFGFRKKDRSSKFQLFVEFVSADKNCKETIKLNIRLSNRTYKNINKLFHDGFDLLIDENTGKAEIRLISQQIITPIANNNIEKHLTIDAFANIYSALIDKNEYNVDDKNRARFNISKKLLCANFHKYGTTKMIKKYLNKFKNFEEPDKCRSRLSDIRQNLKNRLNNIIGKDEESKIIVMAPTNTSSFIYKKFIAMFARLAEDICKQKGIAFKLNKIPCETIIAQIKEYKKKANDYANRKNYGFKFKNQNEVKASDIINASILAEYPDFYIIFKKQGKFTTNALKDTDQNDDQVLTEIQKFRKEMRALNPHYDTFEEYTNESLVFFLSDKRLNIDLEYNELSEKLKAQFYQDYIQHIKYQANEYFIQVDKIFNPDKYCSEDDNEPVWI